MNFKIELLSNVAKNIKFKII